MYLLRTSIIVNIKWTQWEEHWIPSTAVTYWLGNTSTYIKITTNLNELISYRCHHVVTSCDNNQLLINSHPVSNLLFNAYAWYPFLINAVSHHPFKCCHHDPSFVKDKMITSLSYPLHSIFLLENFTFHYQMRKWKWIYMLQALVLEEFDHSSITKVNIEMTRAILFPCVNKMHNNSFISAPSFPQYKIGLLIVRHPLLTLKKSRYPVVSTDCQFIIKHCDVTNYITCLTFFMCTCILLIYDL